MQSNVQWNTPKEKYISIKVWFQHLAWSCVWMNIKMTLDLQHFVYLPLCFHEQLIFFAFGWHNHIPGSCKSLDNRHRQNGTTVISRKHQNSWHFLTSKAHSRHLPETCLCNLHPKMNENICPKQTTYLLVPGE